MLLLAIAIDKTINRIKYQNVEHKISTTTIYSERAKWSMVDV